MKKIRKPTLESILESPDGEFFMERFCNILLQQAEQEALAKTGRNENETRK